jgi:hypothetical protein
MKRTVLRREPTIRAISIIFPEVWPRHFGRGGMGEGRIATRSVKLHMHLADKSWRIVVLCIVIAVLLPARSVAQTAILSQTGGAVALGEGNSLNAKSAVRFATQRHRRACLRF